MEAPEMGLAFVVMVLYALPFAAIWWFLRRRNLFGKPRFPDWIYGLSNSFRFSLARLGFAFGLLFSLLHLQFIWEAEAHPPEGAKGFLAPLIMVSLVTLALGHHVFKTSRLRRSYERTYLEGVPVTATIVCRSENSLRPTPGMGGTMAGAEATMARGAYLIVKGAWKVTIRFQLDGTCIEDTRRVCSRVYYRYRGASSLPILVRPDAPTEWVPELEPRQQKVTPNSSRRVPEKVAVPSPS